MYTDCPQLWSWGTRAATCMGNATNTFLIRIVEIQSVLTAEFTATTAAPTHTDQLPLAC